MAFCLAWGPHFVVHMFSGADMGDCADSAQPCRTVQYAVDQASTGDQVRVAAGVYTDVHVRPRMDVSATGSVSQVVYITKSLSVEGGYSTDDDFSAAYPTVNLTTLNAQGDGRGIYIAGEISVTLAGMQIISGTAYHMGGSADGFDAGSGVYVYRARVSLTGNWIATNWYASQTFESAIYGGGVYLLEVPSAKLQNNTLYWNLAHYGGGLAAEDSVIELSGNTFNANATWTGGAALDAETSVITMSANLVIANGGFRGSSGMRFQNSRAILMNNTIASNEANIGGGVSADATDLTLVDNTIAGNIAQTYAGQAQLPHDSRRDTTAAAGPELTAIGLAGGLEVRQ